MPQTPSAAPGGAPQAPMGVSPATGPTPNKGFEAAAQQKLGSVVKLLEEIVPMAGASSEMGAAVLKALTSLGKFVPPGTVTPASQQNSLQQMQMKNTQNNQAMQALKQGAQGAGSPAAGGMAA